MDVLQTLQLRADDGTEQVIEFGHINSAELLSLMYAQRLRVYNKYHYFDATAQSLTEDIDTYDSMKACVYIGAQSNGRLLGSMRLIDTTPLPLFKTFSFETPAQFSNAQKMGELSRLVVERTGDDKHIPRNILMLFLADVALQYAQTHGYDKGCAYIKQKLVSKLRLLRMPFVSVPEFSCTYPHDGMMAPYFYNQPDDVPQPCFFDVLEVSEFLHSVVRNPSLFEQNGTQYTLRNTLYRKFLSSLGVL